MKKYITCILSILFIAAFVVSCEKEVPEPNYPSIRLKTGVGLNEGAHIYFLALSKNLNFGELPRTEKFDYRKAEADWYIDGDRIPFETTYKDFEYSTGEYYLMLNAAGLVVTTTMSVEPGKQTVLVSGSEDGFVDVDYLQP